MTTNRKTTKTTRAARRTIRFGPVITPRQRRKHRMWWEAFLGAAPNATFQEFRFSRPIVCPVPSDRRFELDHDDPCSGGVIIIEPNGNDETDDGRPTVSVTFFPEESSYAHAIDAERLDSIADANEFARATLRAVAISGRGPGAL